jgi:hypothetical protein
MIDVGLLVELAVKDKTLYPHDFWSWASDLVMTIDEASMEQRAWPKDKAALRDVVSVLDDPDEHLIAIPKSRRMFMSWLLATWCLHKIRYLENVAVLWQSEVESKAAYVIDKRMKWVEEHLKIEGMDRKFDQIKTSEGQVGKMTYVLTQSWVKAVAQGPDVMRVYTPTIVVIDESDFQPQAADALTAALPFAEKMGKVILVTSSNGPGQPVAELCKEIGFTRWTG